jgi:hypothetical protein
MPTKCSSRFRKPTRLSRTPRRNRFTTWEERRLSIRMSSIKMQVVRREASEVPGGSVDSKRSSRPCLEVVAEVEISSLTLEVVRVIIRVSAGSEEVAGVDSSSMMIQMVIAIEITGGRSKGLSLRRSICLPVRTISSWTPFNLRGSDKVIRFGMFSSIIKRIKIRNRLSSFLTYVKAKENF